MYGVILKEQDEFVVIDAYFKGRWRMDRTTLLAYLAYLSAFDQKTTHSVDMASIVRTGASLGISATAVDGAVLGFERERLPRFCNFDPLYLANRIDSFGSGIITPPTSIIEVTPYCNYHCDWCYIPPRSLAKSEFYTHDELRTNVVIPLLETFGTLEWCITGGEPTLFADRTYDVASMIRAESQRLLGRAPKRMYMLTTGYDLASNLDRFQEAGLNSFQVSLSSPVPSHENVLRRPPRNVDSHARAIEAIDAIVARGLRAEINMIIQPQGAHSADNLYDIPEMIKLAKDHHVDMLRIIPAVPCGQAKENHVLMTAFEYSEVARMVAEGRSDAGSLIIDCPIDQRIEKDRSLYCRAGTLWLYFDFRGRAYPCNNLQDPQSSCWPGTIRTDSAVDIWRDSDLLQFMRDYRNTAIDPQCVACDLRVSCAGECRAMTWARYGQFDLSTKPEHCFADQEMAKSQEDMNGSLPAPIAESRVVSD